MEGLAEVVSQLEEAQAQADASSSRAQRFDLQHQRLRTCANRLTTFAFGVSPNGYAASLSSVVTFATRLLAQPLNEDLEDQREAAAKSIQFNGYPRRTLGDTAWRLERKKAEYRNPARNIRIGSRSRGGARQRWRTPSVGWGRKRSRTSGGLTRDSARFCARCPKNGCRNFSSISCRS